MKYEQKSFSVGSTKAYRERYDSVFGKIEIDSSVPPGEIHVRQDKKLMGKIVGLEQQPAPAICGNRFAHDVCFLPRGHKGAHEAGTALYASGERVRWINGMYL